MRAMTDDDRVLLDYARASGQNAYCPYSGFPVGAAVETEQGIYVGCNIENASYGLAICAERVALFQAVAAGANRITRLAVSCLKAQHDDPSGSRMPCGACRQVMSEFMAGDATVIVDGAGVWQVKELLPEAFQLSKRPFLERSTS
jgi:cytidine deaminase